MYTSGQKLDWAEIFSGIDVFMGRVEGTEHTFRCDIDTAIKSFTKFWHLEERRMTFEVTSDEETGITQGLWVYPLAPPQKRIS